jgi:hypothetical protein
MTGALALLSLYVVFRFGFIVFGTIKKSVAQYVVMSFVLAIFGNFILLFSFFLLYMIGPHGLQEFSRQEIRAAAAISFSFSILAQELPIMFAVGINQIRILLKSSSTA